MICFAFRIFRTSLRTSGSNLRSQRVSKFIICFAAVFSPIKDVMARGLGVFFTHRERAETWSTFFWCLKPHKERVRTWSCIEKRAHKYCYWLALFVPTLLERAGTYPGTYWHVDLNPQVPPGVFKGWLLVEHPMMTAVSIKNYQSSRGSFIPPYRWC